MRKSLAALSAAAVIGAGAMIVPTQANATAWWVAPAIIGGAILGTAAIASAAHANAYYGSYGYHPAYAYYPGYRQPYAFGGGAVYVQPRCQVVRERTPYGIRRVRVC